MSTNAQQISISRAGRDLLMYVCVFGFVVWPATPPPPPPSLPAAQQVSPFRNTSIRAIKPQQTSASG